VPRQAGSERNSLRSDNVHFFIRLTHHFDGSVKAEFQQPSQLQQHSPSIATALVAFDLKVGCWSWLLELSLM
jgi:hypothetical protein